MARTPIGLDVTAHKEERNVTDAKKSKLRVRYYVELVALMRMHREFVRLYVEKHGDPHGGLLTGRESFLSNSSSTSRSSVSSVSKGSPTSLSSFVRHTFGLKKKKSAGGVEAEAQGAPNNQHTHHTLHSGQHHQQYPTAQELPGIAPFPAQNKMLVHLESGEAKDDAKIEARIAALFEYYSQLFNSDDGEMYLELVHKRAQERAEKNKRDVENQSDGETGHYSHNSGGFLKLLGHRSKPEDTKSSKHVEFFEPVHVRARGKSRGRRPTRENSRKQAP
ncbi:hypothetical protein ON010_g11802 [Phytophthora cinnamomi]|nr:hypothetical protein ON010_g11802 [Phytophthora cinnamomi]